MEKEKTKKSSRLFIRILLDFLMLVSLLVAGYSAWNIYHALEGYHESDLTYTQVRKEVIQFNQQTHEDKINWPLLQKKYPDIAAWLKMADSKIDYPVVFGDSRYPSRRGNEYYLNHLIDGRLQNSGTLFMDVNNGHLFQDKVWVIYGHNMHNGSMLADIDRYRKQEYYNSHKEMTLETAHAKYKVYPIAGILTVGSNNYVRYRFSSNDDFMQYVNTFIHDSTFKSEQKVNPEDKLVLFSTCDYSLEDGRYALIGKLVRIN